MNILTVSHFYEDHGGGIERVAAQLCREFANQGHNAFWAASDADAAPGDPVGAVALACINPTEKLTGLPMPIPKPSAIRLLKQAVGQSDAVVIHDALYVTSILAMVLAKAYRKPVVLIQHIAGIPFSSRIMRGVMRLANFIVTRPMLWAADRLVFISDTVRRDLVGEPARRDYALLYNGVDGRVFNPGKGNDRGRVRVDYGLPTDAPVALFVGRFVEKKGLSVIEALARRRPDLHFALVGSGPIRPENWTLPNVHMLGSQPQMVIAELCRSADFFLLPSVGEGYPLVIQEAMACGLPVICGADSAIADPNASRWLHGVNIDLSDPAASAARSDEVIAALSVTPADRQQMAAYAAEHYSWQTMAQAIIANINEADLADIQPH